MREGQGGWVNTGGGGAIKDTEGAKPRRGDWVCVGKGEVRGICREENEDVREQQESAFTGKGYGGCVSVSERVYVPVKGKEEKGRDV